MYDPLTHEFKVISSLKEILPGINEYLETNQVLREIYLVKQPAIFHQLKKWIEVYPDAYRKTNVGVRAPDGPTHKIQARAYPSYEHLIKSVITWVNAKENRRFEKRLAFVVLKHPAINRGLNSLFARITEKVGSLDKVLRDRILVEWKTGKIECGEHQGKKWGAYQTYFTRQPPFFDIYFPIHVTTSRKIEIIHDLMEYFSSANITKHATAGAGMLVRPSGEFSNIATVFDVEQGLVRKVIGSDDRSKKGKYSSSTIPLSWLEQVSTRDPQNPLTHTAALYNMPVWAGNSQTTARMLEFVQWLGASPLEMEAVAWSIFAYWRTEYDKAATPYHTFHEVMDVAANYGVSYEPFVYNAPDLMWKESEPTTQSTLHIARL
ncbi:MAG TPA: hypothetical protein VFP84_37205 [Kofleriaceae bacterium]|nr:hypothetical protein [Kofleriaceae bacterium]